MIRWEPIILKDPEQEGNAYGARNGSGGKGRVVEVQQRSLTFS